MVRYGKVWYGIVRYGMVFHLIETYDHLDKLPKNYDNMPIRKQEVSFRIKDEDFVASLAQKKMFIFSNLYFSIFHHL